MTTIDTYIAEQIEELGNKGEASRRLDQALVEFGSLLERLEVHLSDAQAAEMYERYNALFHFICRSDREVYRQGLADGQTIPRAWRATLKTAALPFPQAQ